MKNGQNKCLVIFTLEFPYGKGEAFLENEIGILANHFSKVYVIPNDCLEDEQRLQFLPKNVIVLQAFNYMVKDISIIKTLLTNFFDAIRVYGYELKSQDNGSYKKYYKSLLHYLALDLHKKKRIKKIIDDYGLKDALFYDYWFVNSTISLSLLRREGRIKKLICRAHGFDLYDERQYEKVVSFRNFKLNYLDKVFTISKHGYRYLLEHTPEKNKHKIELSYLGVKNQNKSTLPDKQEKKQLLFVSCSRLLDFKRVHMIPQVLNELDSFIPIKWIHFGDGSCKHKLNEALLKVNKKITFEFKGNVPNQEVHDFYQNNYVDFFISLSNNEGLPVSMMEASAYGIPIIATIVNGVGEIVNDKTGIPLDINDTIKQMASCIDHGIEREFDRQFIQEHFQQNFNAISNYETFIKSLKSLPN